MSNLVDLAHVIADLEVTAEFVALNHYLDDLSSGDVGEGPHRWKVDPSSVDQDMTMSMVRVGKDRFMTLVKGYYQEVAKQNGP